MSKDKETLNAMTLKPTIGRIKPIKPKINVGGKLDHFNGNWYYDKYGGAVLNGGVSFFFAIAGEQNRYKTAIARAIGALAFSRVYWLSTVDEKYTSYYSAFDTETNTEDKRYITMFSKPWYKFAENPVDNERWILSDVGATTFDSWVTNWRNTCKTKRDTLGKQLTVPTPFLERDGSPLTMILPTFTDIDSISQARTEQQNDMHDEHEISSSKLACIMLVVDWVRVTPLTTSHHWLYPVARICSAPCRPRRLPVTITHHLRRHSKICRRIFNLAVYRETFSIWYMTVYSS